MPVATHVIKLTETEIRHIINLLVDNQAEGYYYGPQQQYHTRANRILHKLNAALAEGESDG